MPAHPAAQVSLRLLGSDDLAYALDWAANDEFCRANDWVPHLSPAQVAAWWAPLLRGTEPDFLRLGIEVAGKLVGYTDLADIEQEVGRAEFGIAIGEPGLWGQGIGYAAGQQMLTHGFTALGLSRITAQVYAPNLRSLALMRRLGFTQEGRLRRHALYQGGVSDVVVFGLLRQEFEGF